MARLLVRHPSAQWALLDPDLSWGPLATSNPHPYITKASLCERNVMLLVCILRFNPPVAVYHAALFVCSLRAPILARLST